MHLRLPKLAAIVSSAALLVAFTSPALAASQDKEAQKLFDQAIEEDYLDMKFDAAIEKLNKAIKTCGDDGCSKTMVGKLYVGIGTIQGVGQKKMPAAKESFIKALEADPAAKLMSDFTTEELDKAFADAKKEAKPAGEKPGGEKPGGEKPGGEKPGGEKPGGEPVAAGGDLEYEPPEEAQVNTPLPIFIKVPDDIGADKVKLRYKPFGGTEWQSIDMKAQGGGYAGVVPCADLTTTGKVRLYIIVMDADGVPIATAGSLKEPHVVSIKTEIEGEQPALPGEEPPAKCILKEDCPPNFPGCGKPKGTQRGDKGWGASCEQTQECKAGYVCLNGSCEEGEDDGAGGDDASGGAGSGTHMISIGGQFDLMVLEGTEDVCSLAIKAGEGEAVNYYCYNATDDGGAFAGVPLRAKNTNSLQGGMAFAGVRLLAGYDYVFPFGLGLGARLGYAIGGSPDPGDEEINGRVNPQPFMPFHGEVRGSYFFRMDAEDGFRPFVFLNGGIANMAAGVPLTVCDSLDNDGNPVSAARSNCSGKNEDGNETQGRKREVEAYQVAGQGFIGIGGGLQYAIIENFGVQLDVKMMFMVPTFAFALAPVISPVLMF